MRECGYKFILRNHNKSKKGGKDQELIQSSITPNPGYHMERFMNRVFQSRPALPQYAETM